jgi:hypothetical protein
MTLSVPGGKCNVIYGGNRTSKTFLKPSVPYIFIPFSSTFICSHFYCVAQFYRQPVSAKSDCHN